MGLIADTAKRVLTPTRKQTAADWLRHNFYTHDGRPFNEQTVPWVTAPHGPCWAVDSIQFRELWLQWAARMFKTNFGLGMKMRHLDERGGETMFATPDETNCKSVFGRLWKMLDNCPRFRGSLPGDLRRSKTTIRTSHGICYGAWPRGKSRLADKSIPFGHGNEIDKWEYQSTSTEGDPLPRFLKRGAEYPARKFILESTPGTKSKSRIEAGRLQSTNHRYHVPCPHCCKFQTIEFGDGVSPGGLFWDRDPAGRTDHLLARKTAHYVCMWCEGRIEDSHRPQMMNRGVWVPFGCDVDHDKAMLARELAADDMSWLRGTPSMWSSEYGSQISVFYALFHGWGDIVYAFLQRQKNPAALRQWVNEDKAETWSVTSKKQTWETLGEKIITSVPRKQIPDGCSVVTIGVDKQEEYYVFAVEAWGESQSPHCIDYGIASTAEEVLALAGHRWMRSDGVQMASAATLIDSGFRPSEVHEIVRRAQEQQLPVRACRGSSGQKLPGYYLNKQNSGRSSHPGKWVTWVDTHSTQDWIDLQLTNGTATVFHGAMHEHADFLEQLLNESLVSSLDNKNMVKEEWTRVDPLIPNDLRDCRRYAFVAMLLATRNGQRLLPASSQVATTSTAGRAPDKRKAPALIERPGGWLRGLR